MAEMTQSELATNLGLLSGVIQRKALDDTLVVPSDKWHELQSLVGLLDYFAVVLEKATK